MHPDVHGARCLYNIYDNIMNLSSDSSVHQRVLNLVEGTQICRIGVLCNLGSKERLIYLIVTFRFCKIRAAAS
jgi:hypothetical protein